MKSMGFFSKDVSDLGSAQSSEEGIPLGNLAGLLVSFFLVFLLFFVFFAIFLCFFLSFLVRRGQKIGRTSEVMTVLEAFVSVSSAFDRLRRPLGLAGHLGRFRGPRREFFFPFGLWG